MWIIHIIILITIIITVIILVCMYIPIIIILLFYRVWSSHRYGCRVDGRSRKSPEEGRKIRYTFIEWWLIDWMMMTIDWCILHDLLIYWWALIYWLMIEMLIDMCVPSSLNVSIILSLITVTYTHLWLFVWYNTAKRTLDYDQKEEKKDALGNTIVEGTIVAVCVVYVIIINTDRHHHVLSSFRINRSRCITFLFLFPSSSSSINNIISSLLRFYLM